MKPVELKTSVGYEYYDYHEIIMFKAKGRNSLCYIVGIENPHTILYSISFIEMKYCKGIFFRCYRSCIVNLNHITNLEFKSHIITLTDNHKLKISETYWKAYRELNLINPMVDNCEHIDEKDFPKRNPLIKFSELINTITRKLKA